MDIAVENLYLTISHSYPDFNLKMHSFICACQNSSLTLTEHIDFKWLSRSELSELDWAAADLPIVNMLISD